MKVKKNVLNYKNPDTGEYTSIPVIVSDVNEEIRKEVTELNEKIVQQGKQCNEVRGAFEIIKSNNIVNPNNYESGYFNTDGTKVDSKNHIRTVKPIQINGMGSYIYVTSNVTSDIGDLSKINCMIMFLDSNESLISYKTYRLLDIQYGTINERKTPINCKQIHVYISGVALYGLTFDNICISEVKITEYEKYADGEAIGKLKNEYAPESYNKPLKDKMIVNFGDSIFGKRRPPEDISTRLAELTGATVYNCGFGGCRMAKHSMSNYDAFSMYRLADSIASKDWTLQDNGITDTSQAEAVPSYFSEGLAILKQLDFNKVDIITIAYGTNDFTTGVNTDNSDNALDTTTFAGALRYSIENLLTAYPHLKIFVCSQTYRFWMDSNNVFTDDSDTHVNVDSVRLTDFVAKTKEIAENYHLPYINNYDIGMNKYNRGYYFPVNDGTHPLTTGCHLIAEHMANELY